MQQEAVCGSSQEVFDVDSNFSKEIAKGHELRITPELYDYFLNVLPPRSLGSNTFVFGEGDDLRIRFTRTSEGCHARMLRTGIVGGDLYAEVRFDEAAGNYLVADIHSWGGTDYAHLKDRRYPDIEAIAGALGAKL